MTVIPDIEYERFKAFLKAEASRYSLTIDDYISKIWYHEQAAKCGEYMAICMKDILLNAFNEGEINLQGV